MGNKQNSCENLFLLGSSLLFIGYRCKAFLNLHTLFTFGTKSLLELAFMFSNVKHIFSWSMFFHGQNIHMYVHTAYNVSGHYFAVQIIIHLILCRSYLVMRTFPWQMFLDFWKQAGKVQIHVFFIFHNLVKQS